MIRRFLRDTGGNYAIAMTVALVPIMGGLALALDYGELTRQKQAVLNALDAAGIATARHIVSGADDTALKAYARDFFDANLGSVDPEDATLHVTLPEKQFGGGTLKLRAELTYQPYFLPAFREILGEASADGTTEVTYGARTEIKLKNTLEVSLVLDNSGSMAYEGSGSGEPRLDLLKAAAKELVEMLALEAKELQQVDKPVQFSLVPFAGSVNVGPANAAATWMDTLGLSPAHHENFDWTTLALPDRGATKVDGVWRKTGTGWGDDQNEALTRFTLFDDIKATEEVDGTEVVESFSAWRGCVEARPHPHNVSDSLPTATAPETLFVPMFAPDEPGDRWETEDDDNPDRHGAVNNWWNDGTESNSGQTRLRNMAKYYEVRPQGEDTASGTGPNYSCTTKAITPLTDVSVEDGLTAIKTAIDGMTADGATNVPEGLAWGWRTVSSPEPFTGGRPETEKGNDKVVIVLTDGANTYYTPSSLGYSDPAGAKSTYSAHGYLQPGYNGTGVGRLYLGTTIAGVYSNTNYSNAMNQHMTTLCNGAKAAGIIVMTVALDLDASNAAQAAAIESMRACASDSRFRNDPSDPSKPAKLFWNATGATLSDDFKQIGNELSNLRIVS